MPYNVPRNPQTQIVTKKPMVIDVAPYVPATAAADYAILAGGGDIDEVDGGRNVGMTEGDTTRTIGYGDTEEIELNEVTFTDAAERTFTLSCNLAEDTPENEALVYDLITLTPATGQTGRQVLNETGIKSEWWLVADYKIAGNKTRRILCRRATISSDESATSTGSGTTVATLPLTLVAVKDGENPLVEFIDLD